MTQFHEMTKAQLEQATDELGLTVVGSGSQGRVTRRDYLEALEAARFALEPIEVNINPQTETVWVRLNRNATATLITEGPIINALFEPGQSYGISPSWWRILRLKTIDGEPLFKKEKTT